MKGRKRKSVPRTPSGAVSRAKADNPRKTALAQPHRQGSGTEWRQSAVGRFLEDDRYLTKGISRSALWDAANRFGRAYADWQVAMTSRRPLAATAPAGQREEDVERTLRAIARYEEANTVLQQQGHAIRQATHAIICDHRPDDYVMPFHVAWHLTEGLKVLATHYGLDWQTSAQGALQRPSTQTLAEEKHLPPEEFARLRGIEAAERESMRHYLAAWKAAG